MPMSHRRRWCGAIALGGALLAVVGTGCGATKTKAIVVVPNSPAVSSPGSTYRVPSASMEPTYRIGARVAIGPVGTPTIGSVVIFHPPKGQEQYLCGPRPHTVKPDGQACAHPIPKEQFLATLIKRIVAGPGDEIYMRDGRLLRKPVGAPRFVQEPGTYETKPCGQNGGCDFPTPITIPAEHWFLLGDNRGESDDSRFWGPVPTAWILGTATRCVSHCTL